MIEPRFRSRAQAFLFFGCAAAVAAVTFSSATVQVSAADAPTFNDDVAPIVFEKCASCHRPGAVGAMSLTQLSRGAAVGALDQGARHQARDAAVVGRSALRRLPERHEPHADSRSTRSRRGSTAACRKAPAPRRRCRSTPTAAGALINGRPPDVILEMPMEYELPAEGQIPVFRVWDKNPFKEDVFVQALQIRPSNPSVTHHSALYGRELPEGHDAQGELRRGRTARCSSTSRPTRTAASSTS